MIQRTLLFIFVLLFVYCTHSKKPMDWGKSDYSSIDMSLMIGANSTIRYSETTLDVLSEEKALYTVKKAFTLFDKEDQESLSRILIWYDEFQKVDYIKANILNSENQIVKSFTETDAEDYSAFSGYTFFSDNRVKVLDLFYNSYPYTIELEYEMSLTGLLFLPTWIPQQYNQSVEKANFKLIDRSNTGVRFLQKNFDEQPKISSLENYKTFEWELSNRVPKEREMLSPSFQQTMPLVYVAPGRFKMDDSKGDATTWKSFGKWYYELGKETRKLSDEAKKEVDEVLRNVKSEKEKVQVLYNYLQEKTRYVSIQLGIGGWKPFSAEFVFANEYGDCKALTNYMQTILNYAGIDAKPVLIKNGNRGIDLLDEFPSNQFNHVIIKVTLSTGEEIWLECTSKYMPAGEIGTGNEGKSALLISEQGGELIKTPESKAIDNSIKRTTSIKLFESGDAVLSSKVRNEGSYQHSLLHNLLSVSESQKIKWLEEELPFSNFTIEKADFSGVLKDTTVSIFNYDLGLKGYSAITSSRIFVSLNSLNKWNFNIPENQNRKSAIWFGNRLMEEDSTLFIIPEGYKIESIPSDLSIEDEFGEFYVTVQFDQKGVIRYSRKLIIKNKKINAEDYDKFRIFFAKVSEADAKQVVLVKSS